MIRTRRQGALLAALPLLAILLWTVVYPNVAVISGSLGHWQEFADSPSDVESLINSLIIAVASVGAALLVGVPLGWGVYNTYLNAAKLFQATPAGVSK